MKLTHPATHHEVKTDEASADFWRAAGYRDSETKAPAKKAASGKSKK